MDRLDGKVVIVSGASRGIGKGLALGLAEAGAAVVCAARSSRAHPGELPGTVEDIAEAIGAMGGRAVPVRADIGADEDVQRCGEGDGGEQRRGGRQHHQHLVGRR